MKRALDEYIVKGIKTTIPFHIKVMDNKEFRAGDLTTDFIGATFVIEDGEGSEELRDVALIAAALQMGRKTGHAAAAPAKGGGVNSWKSMSRRSRWLT
jgi:acetyl-CoA carboxylase biotin carboxylase subunit